MEKTLSMPPAISSLQCAPSTTAAIKHHKTEIDKNNDKQLTILCTLIHSSTSLFDVEMLDILFEYF